MKKEFMVDNISSKNEQVQVSIVEQGATTTLQAKVKDICGDIVGYLCVEMEIATDKFKASWENILSKFLGKVKHIYAARAV